jgi:tRNA 2-thiouridine synthesizing protein A
VTDPAPSGVAMPVDTIHVDEVVDPSTPVHPIAHEVDATGLSCPMPVIELAKAVERVSVGEVVALTATDPAARVDVPVWCRMQRHVLRGMEGADGSWRYLVERAR